MSDREDKAVAAHTAAKDAYREDPTAKNKTAKDKTAAKLIEIRNEEREGRVGLVAGDAFIQPNHEAVAGGN